MKYFLYLFVLWVAVCTPSLMQAADSNAKPVTVQSEMPSATPVKVMPKVSPVKASPVKASPEASPVKVMPKASPVKASPASSKAKSIAESLKPVAKGGVAEDIGLVLQNILLHQGEGGSELWRLKASYASMSTKDDITSVEAPVVRYTLGDPALKDYIHVTASKGQITENQRFLVLSGDVQVWRADQRITGPMMQYDAKTRTMTFLKGAHLSTAAGSGSAQVLSWQLDDNILRAKGSVDVRLK